MAANPNCAGWRRSRIAPHGGEREMRRMAATQPRFFLIQDKHAPTLTLLAEEHGRP
jgi:hypothetical protein